MTGKVNGGISVQMPDQQSPSYALTSTFIPQSNGQQTRNVLTGYLAVDSNAGAQPGNRSPNYGQLRLLQLPKDTSVPAPGQVQANFSADAVVSNQLNILGGGKTGSGSRLEYGNLPTLPLAGGLLYVEPVYLRSSVGQTSVPLRRRCWSVQQQHRVRRQPPSARSTRRSTHGSRGRPTARRARATRARAGRTRTRDGRHQTTTPPPSSGPTSPGTTTSGNLTAQQQLQPGPGPSAGGVRRRSAGPEARRLRGVREGAGAAGRRPAAGLGGGAAASPPRRPRPPSATPKTSPTK